MNKGEKIDRLLADEGFQDEVLKLEIVSEEKWHEVEKKYALTGKELSYIQRLLSGFSFRKGEMDQKEIGYALQKFMREITVTQPSAGRKLRTEIIAAFTRFAALLFIPLLIASVFLYIETRNLQKEFLVSSIRKNSVNTVHAPAGVKTQVALPDGSLVWLNSGSSLSYPAFFDRKIRKVELQGEAYFEVVKNERKPMEVSVNSMKVKVHGTKFNINAFSPNEMVETTLIEGKISVIPGQSGEEYLVRPGYMAVFSARDRRIVSRKVENMVSVTGWKDGKLLFQNERFSDIIVRLNRWYNVDIRLHDKSLGDYVLIATFIDQRIEQVLDILSYSIPIRTEYTKMARNTDGSYQKREIIIKRDITKKMKNGPITK
jgi:hypothetical protein